MTVTVEDDAYGVTLTVPEQWRPLPDRPGWEGDDGHVVLDAATGDDGGAISVCRGLAEHSLQPYGSEPTIEAVTIDGQEGCTVMPSDDAPGDEPEAAAVALYPAPRVIAGTEYAYLVLYIDPQHVRDVVATVRFA